MLSPYQLLIKSSYWRVLARRATWIEAKSSLKRAHKDKRARKHLLALGLMLVLPFVLIAYLAWLVGTGALIVVPFVIPVMLWRNRRAKQDAVLLHIAPQPQTDIPSLPKEHLINIRLFLCQLSILHAVIAARGGSEGFLKQKILPEGFEVTSRRIHIDLLRTHGLWERMAQSDRQAMMVPDGHWEWKLIQDALLAIEPLRLLRWILRKDILLPLIGQTPKADFAPAAELLDSPEKAFQGTDLADIPLIREGRNTAHVFFARCFAEAVSRGYLGVINEETLEWAKEISTTLGGNEHEDLVLDSKLVSEVSREDLMRAISLSQKQMEFLDWTISLLEGAVPLSAGFPPVLAYENQRAEDI
jgi:hypothetical protein